MVSEARNRIYPIRKLRIPKYLSGILPEHIADQYCLVPVAISDDHLIIAAANRLSSNARNEIEKITRYPLEIISASFQDIRSVQSWLYQRKYDQPKPVLPEVALNKMGLLNNEQIQSLKKDQNTSIKDLPALAFENHLINEAQWGEVVGLCLNSPHFSSRNAAPIPGISSLSFLISEKSNLLPVWIVKNEFYLATSDPGELGSSLGGKVNFDSYRVSFCAPSLFNTLKQRIYSYVPDQIIVDDDKIAQTLVKRGWLSENDLSISVEICRRLKRPLQSVIRERYRITSKQWLEASGEVLKLPFIHKDSIKKNQLAEIFDLLEMLPVDLFYQKKAFPFSVTENHIKLAIIMPDSQLIRLLESISGLTVDVYLTDEETLNILFDRYQLLSKEHYPREFEKNAISFADFLLGTGILQKTQFLELEKKYDWQKKSLSTALIETKIFDELEIAELLSFFYYIPSLSLDHFQFDDQLINQIPKKFVQEKNILPLFENNDDLWVAIGDPENDTEYFWELEQYTHKRIWPVISPASLIKKTVKLFYQNGRNNIDNKEVYKLLDQLVNRGVINWNDANQVIKDLLERQTPIDQALLRLGKLDQKEIAKSLSTVLNVEYKSIALQEIKATYIDPLGKEIVHHQWVDPVDLNTAHLMDLKTAQRFCALPISRNQDHVLVAFADPLFESAQNELSILLNRKVVPCLSPRDELEAAIQRTFGHVNLGTALLTAGLITLSQLNDGLTLAKQTNVRLGRALVYRRYITEDQLYQFLANQAHLPVFELSKVELNQEIARLIDADIERKLGILPLIQNNGILTMAITDPLNDEAIRYAENTTGMKINPVLVTERDFDLAMERLYKNEYLNQSISQLLERTPEDSAYHLFSTGQIIAIVFFVIISILCLKINYLQYLIVINAFATLFYTLFSLYKGYIMGKALSNDLEVSVSNEEVDALDEKELPVYTILVPVHKEANVLGKILKRLSQMDYPITKLDIKILLESDDHETIDAFYDANPPAFIQEVIIPVSAPRTKPKACNYGLIHAKGEYVVIYDAEDLPDRDQLKKVVVAYQKVPDDVVCIQAKLNYYNRNQNLLTKWFTSEYSMWFDLLLPGLDATRAPIPLGGTSNHFRMSSLLEIGAWDPYNVTEDADLGMRLYKRGYRTRIVDSITLEEANSQIGNWVRQRSRWVKGYIQTWLVHMRHPFRLWREVGSGAFFSFQMLIGGTFFALLMNPIYWTMTVLWYLTHAGVVKAINPGIIFFMGSICLYFGNFIFTYANIAGAIRQKYYDLVRSALFSPIYWALMSIGAWRGFLQLFFKPHFWEKTRHGLSGSDQSDSQNQKGPAR